MVAPPWIKKIKLIKLTAFQAIAEEYPLDLKSSHQTQLSKKSKKAISRKNRSLNLLHMFSQNLQ